VGEAHGKRTIPLAVMKKDKKITIWGGQQNITIKDSRASPGSLKGAQKGVVAWPTKYSHQGNALGEENVGGLRKPGKSSGTERSEPTKKRKTARWRDYPGGTTSISSGRGKSRPRGAEKKEKRKTASSALQ